LPARVAASAFSAEKATARSEAKSSRLASSALSLSLAVTTATRAPASAKALMIVSARRKRASFIITSSFVAGSKK